MAEETFDILAVKILAGEASAEEKVCFEHLLSQNTGLQEEFADLKVAWEALKQIGPITHAMSAPATPLPQYRRQQLDAAVRRQFPGCPAQRHRATSSLPRWCLWFANPKLAACGLALIAVVSGLVLSKRFASMDVGNSQAVGVAAYLLAVSGQPEVLRSGKRVPQGLATPLLPSDEVRIPEGVTVRAVTEAGTFVLEGPERMAAERLRLRAQSLSRGTVGNSARETSLGAALFRPVAQLVATSLLVTTRDSQSLCLYSPREATRSLTPLVLWKGEPGKVYDMTIKDEFRRDTPAWELRGVSSPVRFDSVAGWQNRTLSEDGLYRVQVQESGNPLVSCEHTFRTLGKTDLPLPSNPADKLARAYQALADSEWRPGDALAELMTLPPETADSEIVLRLKLVVFGQLGLQPDYEATLARLSRAPAGAR